MLGRVTNKAIDFLNMLYQIDPKTLEYVVLKPLFEKIYKVFIECEMDLIETASKFFCVVTVNYDDELSDNILYYYLHEEEENWLTEKEFVVLCYFYKNAFWDVNSFARAEFEKKLSDDMSIEFYDKLYEYDESDWDEEDCKYRPVELIRTLSSPSLIEPRLILFFRSTITMSRSIVNSLVTTGLSFHITTHLIAIFYTGIPGDTLITDKKEITNH